LAAELFVLSQWLAFAVEFVDWDADSPRIIIIQFGVGPGSVRYLSLNKLSVPLVVSTTLILNNNRDAIANLESIAKTIAGMGNQCATLGCDPLTVCLSPLLSCMGALTCAFSPAVSTAVNVVYDTIVWGHH
jgi:hypothetical protein